MVYREIIAVCHRLGKNAEFLNAKADGTYSYHAALKGQPIEALLPTTQPLR